MAGMDDERTPLLAPVPDVSRPINEGTDYEEPNDLSGLGNTACCNPFRPYHRFVALFFMCFLSFGSYFCYDNPGSLQEKIKEDMKVDTGEFMELYAWYSWPNVILSFLGGFLIDRVFGIRLGAIIFASFILLGQIIFASGALANHFWLMIVGRFTFGIGGESLAVAQNTYAISWFMGKEVNMVFGFQLSFARVGSTVNFYVMEPLYELFAKSYQGHTILGVTLMIASVTCIYSLLCAIILGLIDKRAKRLLHKESGTTGKVIALRDILTFPIQFWLISGICVTYYVTIFPFIGLGNEFFIRKYNEDLKTANSVDSIVYILSAVASPIFGFLVDRTGRNIIWNFSAVLITIIGHGLLAFTFLNPYFGMVVMGFSYSMLASSLWPLVALVIPKHQQGTAYGIMQSVQNLGLAIFALIAGWIVDEKGYLVLEVLNIACLCVSLMLVVVLWMVDSNRGGKMNLTTKKRRQEAEALEAADRLERERLFASGSMADVTPHDLLQSRSDFSIRNRYLSRLGATLPHHYDNSPSAFVHRIGQLT